MSSLRKKVRAAFTQLNIKQRREFAEHNRGFFKAVNDALDTRHGRRCSPSTLSRTFYGLFRNRPSPEVIEELDREYTRLVNHTIERRRSVA